MSHFLRKSKLQIILFATALVIIPTIWRLRQKEANGYRKWNNVLLQYLKITIKRFTKIYNQYHTHNTPSNPNIHLKINQNEKLLLLFRGPSACGKTTISNKFIKRLKYKTNPVIYSLYFEEDRYRSKLQCRYNSSFPESDLNSAKIICNMIDNIITNIDNEYDIFIVDGLIRYKQQKNYYLQYVDDVNKSPEKYGFKFKIYLFQFHCDRNIRKYRDMKSETREHCLGIGDSKGTAAKAKDINMKKPPYCCWYCKQHEQFPVADVECMEEYRITNNDQMQLSTFKIDTSNQSINESIECIINSISCV